MEGKQAQIRDIFATIMATNIQTEQMDGIQIASEMLEAFVSSMLLSAARHAADAGPSGCERCRELATEFVAAKNATDEEAFDHVVNELYSHMTLESDLAGDTRWLEGE